VAPCPSAHSAALIWPFVGAGAPSRPPGDLASGFWGSEAARLKRNEIGGGHRQGARDRHPNEAVGPPPGLPEQLQVGSGLSCFRGTVSLTLLTRSRGAGFPLASLSALPAKQRKGTPHVSARGPS